MPLSGSEQGPHGPGLGSLLLALQKGDLGSQGSSRASCALADRIIPPLAMLGMEVSIAVAVQWGTGFIQAPFSVGSLLQEGIVSPACPAGPRGCQP